MKEFGSESAADAADLQEEVARLSAFVTGLLAENGELSSENARLKSQLEQDKLTGLLNRGAIHERTKDWLMRAEQEGKQFAIFYCDVDKFKTVNDTLGHQAGDTLLVKIGQSMQRNFRNTDLKGYVGRLSGDEFVLIADLEPGEAETENERRQADLSPAERAETIRLKLKRAIDEELRTAGYPDTRVSMGYAVYEPGDTLESLFERSDQMMYSFKQADQSGNA